jgi:hypothetical protein
MSAQIPVKRARSVVNGKSGQSGGDFPALFRVVSGARGLCAARSHNAQGFFSSFASRTESANVDTHLIRGSHGAQYPDIKTSFQLPPGVAARVLSPLPDQVRWSFGALAADFLLFVQWPFPGD